MEDEQQIQIAEPSETAIAAALEGIASAEAPTPRKTRLCTCGRPLRHRGRCKLIGGYKIIQGQAGLEFWCDTPEQAAAVSRAAAWPAPGR